MRLLGKAGEAFKSRPPVAAPQQPPAAAAAASQRALHTTQQLPGVTPQPFVSSGAYGGGPSVQHGHASSHALAAMDEETLQLLRAVAVMTHLLGAQLGHQHMPITVVLSAGLQRAHSSPLKLAALAAWRVLLACLSARAPALLARVAVQAVVVVLPLLEESGEVAEAATRVLKVRTPTP